MQESTTEEFQTFLNNIVYTEEFKAMKFKKSIVPGLQVELMHLILRGLSGKNGGTIIMSKDRIYVVYNIYSGKTNAVDLTEVL